MGLNGWCGNQLTEIHENADAKVSELVSTQNEPQVEDRRSLSFMVAPNSQVDLCRAVGQKLQPETHFGCSMTHSRFTFSDHS